MKRTEKKHVMGERLGESWIIICYLDNPPAQNYRSKSETAIIIAGCLNVRRFQFFSPFQFPHFGLLSFFAVWSFFSLFRWFFLPFQNRQTFKMTNYQSCSAEQECRQQ